MTAVVPYNQYEAQNAYQRLRACLTRESTEAAITEIKTFLKMFSDVPLAHNDLGVLYHQAGNELLALAHYEKANRLQPNNPTVVKNLAEFYFVVMGWNDDAIEMLTELLNAWPDDFEILTALGNISEKIGRPDEARAFYRKANQLEPDNAAVREILARLDGPVSAAEYRQSVDLPQVDEEIAPLKRLLEQNPANALAHNNLGIIYTGRGEYELARVHHEQAVKYEPANAMYRKNLADLCYVAFGMTDDAVEMYVQLLKDYPNDVEVLTALAIFSKAAELKEQARIFINKVLTLQPWNTEARTFLAGI
ncbi:tetratricopeptide repeat protein [Trichlorobacter lovleyi]|uniref:tetratricopeptide repeat protein n=1 Tax=Trichlorobacter lovleyi TaxID=313985 RepID=UPI00223F2F01|nr:tetratricopeptide repeat protein [Trichlorobacter lovleyi]QOX80349.1 tetratricopeptide repeat protein [Trichlorobacter lovleyi]